jgi:hypothetical protein
MALTLPANIKTYQDRKLMTLEADDYLFILKEFHRLLRRTLEPSVYTVFCAVEDHAGPGEQEDCPAFSCTAATTTIGKETKNGRTTVYRAIVTLEEKGLLTVEERDGRPSIIRPIVTSEQRAAFLLKGEGVNPTCFKLIQDTYPNLPQNETGDMTTRFKMKQPPVSKRNTKETKLKDINKTLDTNVSNGPSGPAPTDSVHIQEIIESKENQPEAASVEKSAPPPDSRGLKRRWREAFEACQGDYRAQSGVMANLWTEITGRNPDYSQLNGLAKNCNSQWVVCEGILKMANYEVVDNPLVFLRKVLKNGEQQQQRRPDLAENSRGGQLEQRAAFPRSIKPTGSGPGGRFTEAELSEGYQT